MSIVDPANVSDSELTALAVAEHNKACTQREAFAQIVARYQSLICSLAYSATGSLSQSEDLAQETFVTAWKKLHSLREPEKLRSWLCGIARNLIAATRHRTRREPSHAASPLDEARHLPAPERLPSEKAISHEEEAIMWRALGHLPRAYREPLVLFYREGQLVADVARELELSEATVKQRLSRGRKLLRAEVAAFVETTLQQSRPGQKFTRAVMAGLPLLPWGSAAASSGAFLSTLVNSVNLLAGAASSLFTAITPLRFLAGKEKKLYGLFLCLMAAIAGVIITCVPEGYASPFFIVAIAGMGLIYAGLAWRLKRRATAAGTPRTLQSAYTKLSLLETRSKWILCGYLLFLVTVHPLATLVWEAVAARDNHTALAIVALEIVAFFLLQYNFICRAPEQRLFRICVLETVFLLTLLATLAVRWEAWRGHSVWTLPEEIALPLEIAAFLCVTFWAVWLKRHYTGHPVI